MIKAIRPKIVAIIGPTASGKSKLAIKLAHKFGGEIVSADSRQIYRGMDIGTAKLPLGKIPNFPACAEASAGRQFPISKIHLIDIKNPDENYTAADYKKDAIAAIRKILRKGKLPILVGGTGLYVKAVTDNLDIPAVVADEKLRRRLESEAKKRGLDFLFKKLVKLDPEAAYIVDPKNPRRVIRALEVTIKTGKPFSAQRRRGEPLFDSFIIGIKTPGGMLSKKINARVDEMIKNDLVGEAENLLERYGPSHKAFDSIGYREVIHYLNGELVLDEAVELIKKNTKNYAKRQMTWFRKDKNIHWVGGEKAAFELTKKFLIGQGSCSFSRNRVK